MKIDMIYDDFKRKRFFKLEITDDDLLDAGPFKGMDALLLRECQKSEKVSDKLLALQMIAQRVEEANERKIGRQKQDSNT